MKKIMACMAAMLFLAACNSSVPVPKTSVAFSEPLPESEGEQLYLDMKCSSCHGHQGYGDGFFGGGLHAKSVDFSSAEVMGAIPDAQLKDAIRNGKGGVMPSYAQFTDHQVTELIRYIRSLAQPPSN
jgi:mono/diheme cytochrome c family protein